MAGPIPEIITFLKGAGYLAEKKAQTINNAHQHTVSLIGN
ncbi:hypothetical protein C900_03055 [Fulvivirga imtechensis AK7]|uniref:Uncharacterized protein n=1 Tax=Fulvivirga imtechensis AK7 TaxID=1237149 RepID=L8JQ56_9BACT|nr:hypothetical protein C900_03055 [Fulvivirga imtechensis AK7]